MQYGNVINLSFQLSPDFSGILQQLEAQGWCYVPHFLPTTVCSQVLEIGKEAQECELFSPAQVGKMLEQNLNLKIRNASTHWINTSRVEYLDTFYEQLIR
jgi:hypothetical protein